MLAGIAASVGAAWLWQAPAPRMGELVGAAVMIAAVVVLSLPERAVRSAHANQVEPIK